jgi:hypothetical protein
MRSFVLLAVAALLASACSEGPPSGCETDCGGDQIVQGVNLTRLFDAPLTAAERDAVRAVWAARTAAATDPMRRPVLSQVALGVDATGAQVIVFAAFSRGDAARETLFVAAVRQPRRPAGDVQRLPGVFVFPDTPAVADAATLPQQVPLSTDLVDEVVMVLVAPRGHALRLGGRTFGAGTAPGEPYLTDADDAQTVLSYGAALYEYFDEKYVMATGLGRGGTTALLLAARDAPVDFVVSLGAPTSFVVPDVRRAARAFLTGGIASSLPAVADVLAATVAPVRDGTRPLADARLDLLMRSPGPFVTAPPPVIAAHGVLDNLVPISQLGGLAAAAQDPEVLTLRIEEADHGTIAQRVVPTVSVRARQVLGLAP